MIKSGFLLVNKELGMTSQKVDYLIKKKFDIKKVGHLGTLDPLATGLLVVGVGQATKYFKYFNESEKTYILGLRLGATSDSLDNETEIKGISLCDLKGQENLIDKALNDFNKEYDQYPPIYSAIKVSGTPLYKYAVKNKDVEITPRRVSIFDIKRVSDIRVIDGNSYVSIYMRVSKGFYVRSFACDFSKTLGYNGMADSIERVKVDSFDISNSKEVDDITMSDLIDPLTLLNFKRVEVLDTSRKYILNGAPYKLNQSINDEYIILSNKGEDLAIYKRDRSEYRLDLLIKNESFIY